MPTNSRISSWRAIAQFDAVHPFSYEDTARAKLVFHLWHVNVLDFLLHQQVAQLLLIRSFVQEIKLGVKADRPFVQ